MYIFNTSNNSCLSGNEDVISREHWDQITQSYQGFLQHDEKCEMHFPVSKEIRDSWTRSRQAGLSPSQMIMGRKLNSKRMSQIVEQNSSLIETTAPQFDKLKDITFHSECGIYLFDTHGNMLLSQENDEWIKSGQFTERGICYGEADMGTTAHVLCTRLKQPLQLIGPEHYLSVFHNMISSTAPIFDNDGNVLAVLALVEAFSEKELDEFSSRKYLLYALCLVTETAAAVESRLKVRRKYSTMIKEQDEVSVRVTNNAAEFDSEDILGESKEIKQTVNLARKFACSEENILLTGESGTGKELFAQAIHNTYRPQGPFVAVNCAAMPRELIESELFGYEGGSFTGADRTGRPGKIELAEGGTLFLDEIGDMPLDLQSVLLRTLEDKKVMRIGGQHYKRVNFRVISATNKNLKQMIKENKFREDLFYRISVLPITIPPLRNRDNDCIILSQYLCNEYCRKMGKENVNISDEAFKRISSYNWPGNIRQLKNAIIYAINTAADNVIEARDLPDLSSESKSIPLEFGISNQELVSLRDWEKAAIENAMLLAKNNKILAADILGIGRTTMYRKVKEYNII